MEAISILLIDNFLALYYEKFYLNLNWNKIWANKLVKYFPLSPRELKS